MDPIVTIVIPVFNTPNDYLSACFNSVRAQDYPALEVVVVDDGSDTQTASFLESECGVDFTLLHKINGGLSDARNFGIKHSSGEYVYFLDSDDELAFRGAIRALVSRAIKAKADLVVGEYHFRGVANCFEGPKDGVSWLAASLRAGISFSAADQLYSRALLNRLDALFSVGLVHEDEEFTPRAIVAASAVYGVPSIQTYRRNERDGSITKSVNTRSSFKRCEGKLVVARNSLADRRYSVNDEVRKLIDERAFSFANMAFRAWAKDLADSKYEPVLGVLAQQIDYSRCRFSLRSIRALRNWFCMKLVGIIGASRYIAFLRRLG